MGYLKYELWRVRLYYRAREPTSGGIMLCLDEKNWAPLLFLKFVISGGRKFMSPKLIDCRFQLAWLGKAVYPDVSVKRTAPGNTYAIFPHDRARQFPCSILTMPVWPCAYITQCWPEAHISIFFQSSLNIFWYVSIYLFKLADALRLNLFPKLVNMKFLPVGSIIFTVMIVGAMSFPLNHREVDNSGSINTLIARGGKCAMRTPSYNWLEKLFLRGKEQPACDFSGCQQSGMSCGADMGYSCTEMGNVGDERCQNCECSK